jgi:hypothetical protein
VLRADFLVAQALSLDHGGLKHSLGGGRVGKVDTSRRGRGLIPKDRGGFARKRRWVDTQGTKNRCEARRRPTEYAQQQVPAVDVTVSEGEGLLPSALKGGANISVERWHVAEDAA